MAKLIGKSIFILIIDTIIIFIAIVTAVAGNNIASPIIGIIILIGGIIAGILIIRDLTPTLKIYQEVVDTIKFNSSNFTLDQIMNVLIENGLIQRSEAIGQRSIYQLDEDYWTNIVIDTEDLASNNQALKLCANYIRQNVATPNKLYFVHPNDFGETNENALHVLNKLVKQCRGKFIKSNQIHQYDSVFLLSAHYSTQIRNFLLKNSEYISSAVFLLGPDDSYLSEMFNGINVLPRSLVSSDALNKVDKGVRKTVIW